MKPAIYFDELDEDVLQCFLCPHHCVIKNGETGHCRVRKNVRGMLYSLNYGQLTAIAVDPMEKKPLYHFYPGSKILSVGSWGCNLNCDFCQNWEIAAKRPRIIRSVSPAQLIEIATSDSSEGIAFTYNEPAISFEFVLDTSRAAAKEGIYSIMVTNGLIESEPLELLLQSISAMNIDLKGWNDEFYKEIIGTDKENVLRTIEQAFKANVHIELTTLIIPGRNDSPEEMEEEVKWIAGLSKDIPLHLTRYFPNYECDIPETPLETLEELYQIAKKHLNYVYIGNVDNVERNSTYCPDCGKLLIERNGFQSKIIGVDEEGRCIGCGKETLIRI